METTTFGQAGLFFLPMQTICFTGPRPSKLPHGGEQVLAEISKRLEEAIKEAVARGFTFFLNGCMAGFDVMAGEAVQRLKSVYPFLCCASILPYRSGFFEGKYMDAAWRERAIQLYRNSDFACSLAETYFRGAYFRRDKFLVDHASGVICYYRNTGGGTKYTLDYAVSKGLPIQNLAV